MTIAHRLGSEVANPRLDVHPAIGLDDEQPVVAGRSGNERARRDAVTANLRALTLAALRLALVPPEHLRAAIERLFDERASRVCPLTARVRRTERRFAFRRVDPMDGDLVDAQLARGFREN